MPYALFLDMLKDILLVPRKEKDVKKRIGAKLDLVAAQVKHWLEEALQEGVIVRKEYQNGKKITGWLIDCTTILR